MTEPEPLDLHSFASLEQYVSGVSGLPVLEREREATLLERIARGGADASASVEALVAGHLRHVVDEALRMRDTGVPLPALIESGNRGLREAALRFRSDGERGFGDYARAWIRREMREHLDSA